MGRRLAEATKACRARRTRGETVLCFFLAPVDATGFRLAAVVFGVVFAGVVFAAALADWLADGFVLEGLFAGALSAGVGEVVWATAGDKGQKQWRKKIPAKTTTAQRRTQTLPTAESWHP
jgi:hypothetical protein